jgi:hypothetical protein
MSYGYVRFSSGRTRSNVNGIVNPHHQLCAFARGYWHQHCSMTVPTFSIRETAHANSTGEQHGGDINRQQEIACGEVRRVRREDVSQFTSEAASYAAPAAAGIVGDRAEEASGYHRAHESSMNVNCGIARQCRSSALRSAVNRLYRFRQIIRKRLLRSAPALPRLAHEFFQESVCRPGSDADPVYPDRRRSESSPEGYLRNYGTGSSNPPEERSLDACSH